MPTSCPIRPTIIPNQPFHNFEEVQAYAATRDIRKALLPDGSYAQPTGHIGDFWWIDHHAGVPDRLTTPATCGQHRDLLQNGELDQLYFDKPDPLDFIAVGTDMDVVVTLYEALHPELVLHQDEKLAWLINTEDMVDRYGGGCPIPLTERQKRQFAWLSYPSMRARLDGKLKSVGPHSTDYHMHVLNESVSRIDQLVHGRCGELEIDTTHLVRYQYPNRKPRIALVREMGAQARMLLLNKYPALISAETISSEQKGVLGWSYTIISNDRSAGLDMALLTHDLIMKEPGWGGGSTIIGSPYGRASVFQPADLFRFCQGYLL